MYEILQNFPEKRFLVFTSQGIFSKSIARNQEENRETLLRFYRYLIKDQVDQGELRFAFSELFFSKKSALPKIMRDDGFLALFAEGKAIRIKEAKQVIELFEKKKRGGKLPIFCDFTPDSREFFEANATLPGFLPKVFPYFRLRTDRKLLDKIEIDLKKTAEFPQEKRKLITFMILSFFLAYRECEGLTIDLPHFTEDRFVRYRCHTHLIGEGLKTISMVPLQQHPPIYLCQGTEMWPSQPSMLSSILNNFAEHGSATQTYAHSWRRIHKQLRDLHLDQKPIVMGHSMGGSLAMQIALYSHDLIEESYAFNPPMPGKRDAQFFEELPKEIQKKMQIFANLDDVAFWRMGECVFGNVTCFLSQKRWRYYPIYIKDMLLIVPALFKLIWNIKKAFPAHQKIFPLTSGYLFFTLSKKEIEEENLSRKKRFDALHFFPKLYDPLKWLIYVIRKIFKWSLEEEMLRNEIEILALHERDLLDTITLDNASQIKKKIHILSRQKQELQDKLKKYQS